MNTKLFYLIMGILGGLHSFVYSVPPRPPRTIKPLPSRNHSSRRSAASTPKPGSTPQPPTTPTSKRIDDSASQTDSTETAHSSPRSATSSVDVAEERKEETPRPAEATSPTKKEPSQKTQESWQRLAKDLKTKEDATTGEKLSKWQRFKRLINPFSKKSGDATADGTSTTAKPTDSVATPADDASTTTPSPSTETRQKFKRRASSSVAAGATLGGLAGLGLAISNQLEQQETEADVNALQSDVQTLETTKQDKPTPPTTTTTSP